MTVTQQLITLGLCALATLAVRFLPFLVFSEKRKTPDFIRFIGRYLPSAVFGMLVVYCLKDVKLLSGSHGIPEAIAIVVTATLHLWKRQFLISIAGGTIIYMLLLQFVF